MPIQPNQPQSIGGVLDTVFQLYKVSLPHVLPVSFLAALSDLPAAVYGLRLSSQLQNATDVGQVTAAAALTFTDPVYYAIVFVGNLLKLWLIAALAFQISAIGKDEPLTVKAALTRGVRPVAAMFVASILYSFALILGTLLLLIPGMILGVSLVLGFILVPLEGKGPLSALKASHQLVWGCWWRTTAILTVGAIILIVIFMALALVIGLSAPLLGGTDSSLLESASTSIITVLVTLILSPLYVSMLIVLYWDLKLRKQGSDLEARVGALGARA